MAVSITCNQMLSLFRKNGFTDSLIDSFFQDSDLLKESFLLASVKHLSSSFELRQHLLSNLFTTDFVPLNYSSEEWGDFIKKRSAISDSRSKIDDQKTHPKFFKMPSFNDVIPEDVSQMILISPDARTSSVDDVIDLAESQIRGCFDTTKPRLIFDAVNMLWDMAQYNASYIVVPKKIKEVGDSYPVVLNILGSGKLFSFIRGLPKDKSGFVVFCGQGGVSA